MMLILWLTIWMPAYRLEEYSATFTRLQPLLVWNILIGVQFALSAWLMGGQKQFQEYPH